MGSTLFADGRLLRGQLWEPFVADVDQADFYIAPNGRDSWSGTLAAPNRQNTDGPFATIGRSQEAVRELKKTLYKKKKEPIEKRWIGSPHKFGQGRDILVLVRGGTYHLSKPLEFSAEDGGERCETNLPTGAFEYHKLKDYFVTYAAYPGETPILCGGPQMGPWNAEEGGIWTTPVNGIQVSQLVVEGQRQRLARTPNQGFYTAAKTALSPQAFQFRPGDLQPWPEMQENRIVMLLRWHTGINTIARIDPQPRMVHLKNSQPGISVIPPRYYVENIRALLDAPGEWFFDRKTMQLSYLPTNGLDDLNSVRTIIPTMKSLIVVAGQPNRPVRNLRIYGLQLEATTPDGHALTYQYAHRCELVGATLRAVGGIGIHVGNGCYQLRILRNRVLEADGGGIAVVGNAHPKQWFDIIRETVIEHNFVADCGGRSISAANSLYTVISHNEVTRNRGRTAISVGGWKNLEEAIDGGYRIEYNHVHHVQQQADDSGAITTAGMTIDSIVRANLIHDVHGGFFNDNVAIWFDNMSSGWRAEENIYYNLEQGSMKLCACNLVDNLYQNNFLIEPPSEPPVGFINGTPVLKFNAVTATSLHGNSNGPFQTGAQIEVRGNVRNTGSTGVQDVHLFIDGRHIQSQLFPVIQGNERQISFRVQFSEPGDHQVAIEDSEPMLLTVVGPPRSILIHSLSLSDTIIPSGNQLSASATVQNVENISQAAKVTLVIDDAVVETRTVQLTPRQSQTVRFEIKPGLGSHEVRIGDTQPATVDVFSHDNVPLTASKIMRHCSSTAAPCNMTADLEAGHFRIEVAGTDFFHGEDSYGAQYVPSIRGNFIATVKIKQFGQKTHEWFRAGLFARNDMAQSYDTSAGSLGSVLIFATPGRVGMNWDEYGDGCMHKAQSRNRETTEERPIWLRLVRHGDSFSGYSSADGQTWFRESRTGPIPGLAEAIDLGLAAGGCDQRIYEVEFEDFSLEVEQPVPTRNEK